MAESAPELVEKLGDSVDRLQDHLQETRSCLENQSVSDKASGDATNSGHKPLPNMEEGACAIQVIAEETSRPESNSLENENERSRRQQELNSAKLKQMEEILFQYESDNKYLKSQIESKDKKLELSQVRTTNAEREAVRLRKQILELEDQIKRLTQEANSNHALANENTEFKKRNEELQNEISGLRVEVETLQSLLNSVGVRSPEHENVQGARAKEATRDITLHSPRCGTKKTSAVPSRRLGDTRLMTDGSAAEPHGSNWQMTDDSDTSSEWESDDYKQYFLLTQALSDIMECCDWGGITLSQHEINAIKNVNQKRNKFVHSIKAKSKTTISELPHILETLLSHRILDEELITELEKYKSTLIEIFEKYKTVKQ